MPLSLHHLSVTYKKDILAHFVANHLKFKVQYEEDILGKISLQR